jgi:hypothetical protein
MNCGADITQCDTVQIIEPNEDLLVDTAGQTNDMDERGELLLTPGQINAVVVFEVPKLNPHYHFEYLYVDAMGDPHPGSVQVVATVRAIEGFAVTFAGAPITVPPGGLGYVLHWRVVVTRQSTAVIVDAPEDLNVQMPRTNTMTVNFNNPRSGTNYGFTELRVENLTELPNVQAIIRVQVYRKFLGSFQLAVNPTPPSNFYFLRVRTP